MQLVEWGGGVGNVHDYRKTNKRPKGYKDQDNLTVKLKSFQRVSNHRYTYTPVYPCYTPVQTK